MDACAVCDGTGKLLGKPCPLCDDFEEVQEISESSSCKEGIAKRKGQIDLEPPSGTRDFAPDDLRFRNWLLSQWRTTAKKFGFDEYDAPILERQELFTRKGGEDIVEEMYAFTDKDGVDLALRPEMTPSLVRMVMKTMQDKSGRSSLRLPLKWFSVPQCWRFETVQRGRKREFYQWNMDILGVADIKAEVEIMGAACDFLKSIGLNADSVKIKFNSRKILSVICDEAGVPDSNFEETTVIVDKLNKIGVEECKRRLMKDVGLCDRAAGMLLTAVQVKGLDDLQRLVGGVVCEAVDEIRQLLQYADAAGFADWLEFDASVVRGLAYYTGIVFEAFDQTGGIGRAIAGGGRFDKLMSTYGSKTDIPAVGFGMGDVVLKEILEAKNLMPKLAECVDFFVIPFAQETNYAVALELACKLRTIGKTVNIEPTPQRNFAKAIKLAKEQVTRPRFLVLAGRSDKSGYGIAQVTDLTKEKSEPGAEIFATLEDLSAERFR
eukprot:TRINITY_DN47879_c0_g1_i1.p1 TRINITY_DN47879_c0_g1~~TRINITY_DN47879_c0_g1_i1.p1  ORF type:complete len:492 (-),score=112.60 TRINITY_DN47879_c0_g1_i1:145-1620(-)